MQPGGAAGYRQSSVAQDPAYSVACLVLGVAARLGMGVRSWCSCDGTALVATVRPCAFAASSRECVLMAMFRLRR